MLTQAVAWRCGPCGAAASRAAWGQTKSGKQAARASLLRSYKKNLNKFALRSIALPRHALHAQGRGAASRCLTGDARLEFRLKMRERIERAG